MDVAVHEDCGEKVANKKIPLSYSKIRNCLISRTYVNSLNDH